jgi:hypothetical protein
VFISETTIAHIQANDIIVSRDFNRDGILDKVVTLICKKKYPIYLFIAVENLSIKRLKSLTKRSS